MHSSCIYSARTRPNLLRLFSAQTQALRVSANGFTLVELLIVLVVIAILLTVAVPAYSAFAGRARVRTAEHQIRAAMPARPRRFASTTGPASGSATP